MLTLIFIVLKLNGVINWDWVWVLCPLWIPIIVTVGFYLITFIITLIAGVFGKED